MKRFKDQIVLVAGFVVLAGVITGITAAPAIAQAVKAALVRDVDNPARHFITLEMAETYAPTYTVPAGKILVLEQVLGGSQNFAPDTLFTLSYNASIANGTDNNRWSLWMQPQPCNSSHCPIQQSFHVYAKGGQTLTLSASGSGDGSQLYFQGYLLDAN